MNIQILFRSSILFLVLNAFMTPHTLAKTSGVSRADAKTQKTYSESPEGMRSLLKDLERNQRKVYLELKPEGERLISKMETAQAVSLYSTLGGIGVMGYTLIRTFSGSSESPSEGSDFNFFTGVIVSAGLIVGGRIATYFLSPDRQEVLDFINKHNELNPKDQLEHKTTISITMTEDQRGGRLGLQYHF
jgi:hypothetical protein